MSMFSAAFTRLKGAITSGVAMIPVVGGAASNLIGRIHTGDEHQDAAGNWVSNSTGEPVTPAPGAAVQAEIDRARAFDAAELARLRQAAADTAARLGTGASLELAQRLAPEEGKGFYKMLQNPAALAGGAAVVGLLLYLALRKK